VVSVRVRYEKTAAEENDGRIDVFDLYISRTFLETRRSDEVSQLSIKVDQLKRSNEVTKVGTTPMAERIAYRTRIRPAPQVVSGHISTYPVLVLASNSIGINTEM
jgi:hypothetical protein